MKRVRVSAAVIHRDGTILIARRAKGAFKGFWEFPGGKQEPGESGEEAIIREIREELKLDIQVDSFLCTVEYQYPEFLLIMDVYLVSIINGELTLLEHDNAMWLKFDLLDNIQWLPADRKALNEIKSIKGIF